MGLGRWLNTGAGDMIILTRAAPWDTGGLLRKHGSLFRAGQSVRP
jgi:hypothetical protein